MNKKNPYIIEKLRQSLASKNNLDGLKVLYDKPTAQIPNLNTASFWNKRIEQDLDHVPPDGMTNDRIDIAYKFMPKNVNRILDIGAGYGYIEHLISKNKNIKIYGNDISENAIKNLNRRFSGNFRLESVYKMKYKPNMFDAIFMLEVLEHIPPGRTFKVLEDVKRFLTKNGSVIISVPTNEGLEKMQHNLNGHVRMYTKDLITAELRIAGFKVISVKTLSAFRNLYIFKKLISKVLRSKWEPNDIIIVAKSV
jgi:2-polyprenyl-3-methyl-5-hydroxy-6-metoxy-1,4-benzoquinol methylase